MRNLFWLTGLAVGFALCVAASGGLSLDEGVFGALKARNNAAAQVLADNGY